MPGRPPRPIEVMAAVLEEVYRPPGPPFVAEAEVAAAKEAMAG